MTARVFDLNELDKEVAFFWEQYGKRKVFAFSGAMGVGKTTWIHALCHLLGVTDAVSSPTFSLINHYQSAARQDIYHLDLYRLTSLEEAMNAGVGELLEGDGICLIEWPDIIRNELPPDTVWITLSVISSQQRSWKVSSGA
ncbi:MAG: tRNA (adenosine(37)-N6)-threonylcarbamoyltransferase complex ATPase subunit type 1 TsaE [Bacteroidetes bacterium]|nr:tRNA (adenosine(37)-N6)-threonylcarbamoyltransferase complex ATPase subunit type 1 TsaE [Bacteroidota bacterium]